MLFAHFQILLPDIESILAIELVAKIKFIVKSHYNENCLINCNLCWKILRLVKSYQIKCKKVIKGVRSNFHPFNRKIDKTI